MGSAGSKQPQVNNEEFNLGRLEMQLIDKALHKAVCMEEASKFLGIHEKTIRIKVIHYKLYELYHFFGLKKPVDRSGYRKRNTNLTTFEI